MAKELMIYTDGASQGNPGNAGIGVAVFDKNETKISEVSRYIGIASNNVAEYTALITGLIEAAALGCDKLVLKTDSELVVKQLNGQYKVKSDNIKALFFIASNLKKLFKQITISHIPRNLNKEADALASKAASNKA